MSSSRILVVEDEYAGAEVLAQILREEGYAVALASNGRQGLEQARQAAYDLVVTDYMMPMMNGIDMARAIRALPGGASLPVLLMSGVPRAALPAAEGAYDRYLRKPFEGPAFLALVRELLEGAAPSR